MATPSEVKAGLDDAAQEIRTARQALKQAKARISSAKANLSNIPTKHAELINTINGYTGANEFETQAQADLSALTSEFGALETKASSAETALDSINFDG